MLPTFVIRVDAVGNGLRRELPADHGLRRPTPSSRKRIVLRDEWVGVGRFPDYDSVRVTICGR